MAEQDRSRSRSPARKPKKVTGFKWKERRPRDDNESRQERAGGTLGRGYRDRSPPRRQTREDSRDRDDYSQRRYKGRDQNGDGSQQIDRRERDRHESRRRSKSHDRDDPLAQPLPKEKKKKKKKDKPVQAPINNEPMIVVNVNDRLGTKAAIPCFASDSIKGFKAMVAAHIGRKPHEILIKRQGERPMKDILTLADYGVSNGVQLDLELDTGD
ncbi:ubiquitin-like protein [Polychaeton citri CBS 116435]|uniref:Ubiquitin-like modifier HUB1 n=1 Tax=Polychaeton citri CBS 116435 TaxID=1314669 RepID=A0A9P4QBC5_9PEZI|nr:ubiquitin-like protein [Polychaeton citri CBS 116435]